MKRLFVSVPVDGPALRGVSAYVRENLGLRPVPPENAHITMLFIGDYPENRIESLVESLENSISGTGAFPYSLKGVGKFPERGRPRVLWVGAEGAGFGGLHAAACEALGKKPDRRFVPHVTVCRVRKPIDAGPFLVEFDGEVFGTGICNSVHLMESELTKTGARYKLVRKIDC